MDMRRRRARCGFARLFAAASVATAISGGVDKAHATDISWWNGNFVSTDLIFSCVVGTLEYRMQAYVGYGLHPGNRTPAVGEVWYAHLVISHPGNVCAGGSATGIHFVPPPNTQLAVSGADPLFCFWRRHDSWQGVESYGTLFNMAGNCNQNPPWTANGYSLHAINPTQPWVIPNYSWMEFLIPLRSTAPVSGADNTWVRLNPDLGVFAYPSVSAIVNNDVMFRDSFDGTWLFLDLCTLSHTAGC
jgi:hypothetical protein